MRLSVAAGVLAITVALPCLGQNGRRLPPPAAPSSPPAAPVRVSAGVMESLLRSRVLPDLPSDLELAPGDENRVVVLGAVIGADGVPEELSLLSGAPTLAGPVREAVRQWRYQPFLLNGRPVRVETTIVVDLRNLPGALRERR